jgi:uncharacterized protein (DUF849 family)
MAAAIGAHVRVGLEDSLWIGKGRLARSNAEQVRRVRSIVAGLGLAPAKPNEARDILQLKRGVVLISTSSSARVSLQDLKRGD